MQTNSTDDTAATATKSKSRKLVRILYYAAASYLGVCLLLTALQAKLIYFPSRGYDQTPADVGLDFEQVSLTSADGVRVVAWYVPHESPRATVLFLHGNAGNIADRIGALKIFHDLGCDSLILDYRGYGESEGSPSEEGTYLDAVAAFDHLTATRGIPAERIVVLGRSLGGGIATELATRRTPGALVIDSSFTRIADVGKRMFPFLPVNLIVSIEYDSAAKVQKLSCPKLFFHATDDSLIPIEIGRKLYESAAEPKQFIETPGEHNTGGFDHSPEFVQQLGAFIDSAIPTGAP